MTDTTNYRVIARDEGQEMFDVIHKDAYTDNGCGEVLLTTQNVSVQTLTDLAHKHSLTCKRHP